MLGIRLLIATAVGSLVVAYTSTGAETRSGGDRLLIGPLKLGDLYSSIVRKKQCLSWKSGPSRKQIVEALNACTIYLLDRRKFSNGNWSISAKQSQPTILASGPFVYELTDANGKPFRAPDRAASERGKSVVIAIVKRSRGTYMEKRFQRFHLSKPCSYRRLQISKRVWRGRPVEAVRKTQRAS